MLVFIETFRDVDCQMHSRVGHKKDVEKWRKLGSFSGWNTDGNFKIDFNSSSPDKPETSHNILQSIQASRFFHRLQRQKRKSQCECLSSSYPLHQKLMINCHLTSQKREENWKIRADECWVGWKMLFMIRHHDARHAFVSETLFRMASSRPSLPFKLNFHPSQNRVFDMNSGGNFPSPFLPMTVEWRTCNSPD